MVDEPSTTLSGPELATRAGVDLSMVDRLVQLRLLTPDDAGRFGVPDVYRVRLIDACETAGMEAEAIARAIDEDRLSLSFVELPHYRWAAVETTTFGELAERLDLPIGFVLELAGALGSGHPSADDRIREDDRTVFELMQRVTSFVDADSLMRISRVYVDGFRRIAEAESSLFDIYLVQGLQQQGLGLVEAVDLANRLGAELTPMQEQVILAMYRRQQERRWTEYTIEGIERVVEEMGLYRRPERPPAFAFVDLAGYTRLTDERGDREGARIASGLAQLVDRVAVDHGGIPVKWLGDGVMVSFRDPEPAVRATLEMVARAPAGGLPAHAGVAAGPVVVQDGDYFGRTVNMASRIAAMAAEGQTLVNDTVVTGASTSGLAFREIGALDLKGFADPVRVFEASGR